MTPTSFRAVHRLLTRTATTAVAVTLVVTGVVAPQVSTGPRAEVTDRVQALTRAVVGQGWSRAVDAGQPTNLVGFEWAGRKEGAVEVRAEGADGWTDWQRAEGDPMEGPDADSPEHHELTTAGPVWVGAGVRRLEVRVVEGSLPGLTLHALRSEEPSAGGGGGGGGLGGLGGIGVKPAGAAPAQPGIVSRSAWGADESYRSLNPGCATPSYAPSVRVAIVHHTVTTNSYTPADSASLLRGIYYFHTHTNQWCDIGYNFLVDRFGTVFEGRYGGIDKGVVGAHAQGFNTGSTGVALLGTFQSDPVPSPMYGGLRSLLAWKLAVHGIDPLATITFDNTSMHTVIGHRDVNATLCPGDVPEGLLPQLRNDLAGIPPAGTLRTTVRSAQSGKLMDVNGVSKSPGAAVIQWPANGGLNQRWDFVDLGNGAFKVVSVNSGLVLDVEGVSVDPGAQVIQWPWNGGPNQQWRVTPLSALVSGGDPSLLQIASVHSGLVLDVYGASDDNGARFIQWPWHGRANQQWAQPGV